MGRFAGNRVGKTVGCLEGTSEGKRVGSTVGAGMGGVVAPRHVVDVAVTSQSVVEEIGLPSVHVE